MSAINDLFARPLKINPRDIIMNDIIAIVFHLIFLVSPGSCPNVVSQLHTIFILSISNTSNIVTGHGDSCDCYLLR